MMLVHICAIQNVEDLWDYNEYLIKIEIHDYCVDYFCVLPYLHNLIMQSYPNRKTMEPSGGYRSVLSRGRTLDTVDILNR